MQGWGMVFRGRKAPIPAHGGKPIHGLNSGRTIVLCGTGIRVSITLPAPGVRLHIAKEYP